MHVRELDDADIPWLEGLIAREWGLPVVSISGIYNPSTLPGFVAEGEQGRLGVVTYRVGPGECEVVTLNSLHRGQGAGTALLASAKRVADEQNLRLWLVTTNDNINAIRFYQRRGMDMVAIHRNFVERLRREKPAVVETSDDGIPLRHAIEFSY